MVQTPTVTCLGAWEPQFAAPPGCPWLGVRLGGSFPLSKWGEVGWKITLWYDPTVCYGKSPYFQGSSSMAIFFNCFLYVYFSANPLPTGFLLTSGMSSGSGPHRAPCLVGPACLSGNESTALQILHADATLGALHALGSGTWWMDNESWVVSNLGAIINL